MLVFYQIVMIGIFMYGYSAVPKNVTELTVAIVNEDTVMGDSFVQQLEQGLPFNVKKNLTLSEAQTDLENRDIHLVVHIPADFSENIKEDGKQGNLEFFINESNPTLVASSMQSIAAEVGAQITTQVQTQSFVGAFTAMNVPAEQATQMVTGIMEKISVDVEKTNKQPLGMHNQMAPMFLTMAMYVGAMIYSMMSVTALNEVRQSVGKWRAFFSLQLTNIVIAIVAPLVGVSIYFIVQGYGIETFLGVWMVHALQIFASIQFTTIACLLLGPSGMLLNIPLLLTQTIANGATIPYEMMPGVFKFVSHISPMFYSVHLDYNLFFGGGTTGSYAVGLVLVALGALAINAMIHQYRHYKPVTKPAQIM
ncbi:YhgE/Pip N-terminal domain protein [Lysinibacillus contaminans]|uniref:YhgE/Pip N-terminal domain protein n=2 Tax=Lysinibacillus contaminans TaxID=1293441 RepID=A0ABR5K4P5_9BACI|nr:YhgE/Pip N-terminal domain protein [Lysinibacillus contaminans]